MSRYRKRKIKSKNSYVEYFKQQGCRSIGIGTYNHYGVSVWSENTMVNIAHGSGDTEEEAYAKAYMVFEYKLWTACQKLGNER